MNLPTFETYHGKRVEYVYLMVNSLSGDTAMCTLLEYGYCWTAVMYCKYAYKMSLFLSHKNVHVC